jgi:multidrug efflux pump subunit AcrA (membrane-fusion protein)
MSCIGFATSFLALAALLCSGVATGQEKTKADKGKKTEAAKPAETPSGTHTVKKAPFKIEVNLTGAFVPSKISPVVLRPETWSAFTVIEAVPHGAKVKKGQSLVRLDMRKIEEQLQDLEYDLELGQLSIEIAESDLAVSKDTLPLDLEAAERAKKIADEDLDYFLKVSRPRSVESAKFSLKNSKHYLEYAEEELKQLLQMYEADDLTEETEEIILKRSRNDVESAKFSLKSSEIRTKQTLEQTLPRREKEMRDATARANLAWSKAKIALQAAAKKKEIEHAKLKLTSDRSLAKFEKLKKDAELMKVPAPADGYVYYGSWTRGKWSGAETVKSQLKRGGKLAPNQIFMTIVEFRPLTVEVNIPEKDLQHVKSGVTGKAVPTAFPDLELPATVGEVSAVPVASGSFAGNVQVQLNGAEGIVPGMNCKLTLIAYEKDDAIAIPAAAVFADGDGPRNVVYVAKSDDESEKRIVEIGKKTEQKWEVLSGLEPGDKILLKKPDDSK